MLCEQGVRPHLDMASDIEVGVGEVCPRGPLRRLAHVRYARGPLGIQVAALTKPALRLLSEESSPWDMWYITTDATPP